VHSYPAHRSRIAAIAALLLAFTVVPATVVEARTVPVTPAPTTASGDVIAIHRSADGSTTVNTFQPTAAVTPTQLYAQLKAAGMADLVDPSLRTVQPLDNQSCFHGTAYAEPNGFCPPYSWSNQGHPRPIVYFRDFTGAAWPVSTAASTWNSSVAIDSIWIPSESHCPSNVHCVPVYEQNVNENYCGHTTYHVNSSHLFTDATVYLNDYHYTDGTCGGTRRATACHELGHVLGLAHNTSTGSCMYSASVTGMSQTPNSDDYWVLANISY